MSESVIADFVASFNSEATTRAEPVKGRILLSEKRLVLAADEGKVTVPLSSIFDVAVGHVPEDLGDFFKATVTVAFERTDRRMVAAIEADDETVEKFSEVLFKALLNGTEVTVKHPARRGGRVTGAEFEPAKLFLKPRAVKFKTLGDEITVRLFTVSGFERLTRKINGTDRPVLAVRHMPGSESLTTLAGTDSSRRMTILSRFLRLEYSDLMAELEDIELSDEEIETLVAIYSTGPGMSLANVLDVNGSQVTMVLNDLESDDLVRTTDDGPQLTPMGRVVISNHLEDVDP